MLRIENLGELNWDSNAMFLGCANLSCTAPDIPNFTVANLSTTFGDNDSLIDNDTPIYVNLSIIVLSIFPN